MSDFLAAAVQLTSGSDPESNFSAAEEQIELAARRGAELVGFFAGKLLWATWALIIPLLLLPLQK